MTRATLQITHLEVTVEGESKARPTNELPAGVMCRRNGDVFKGEVRVGHVEKSAESNFWRATHADGREVVASFSPKVVDFATRRGAVEAMLKTGAGAG